MRDATVVLKYEIPAIRNSDFLTGNHTYKHIISLRVEVNFWVHKGFFFYRNARRSVHQIIYMFVFSFTNLGLKIILIIKKWSNSIFTVVAYSVK